LIDRRFDEVDGNVCSAAGAMSSMMQPMPPVGAVAGAMDWMGGIVSGMQVGMGGMGQSLGGAHMVQQQQYYHHQNQLALQQQQQELQHQQQYEQMMMQQGMGEMGGGMGMIGAAMSAGVPAMEGVGSRVIDKTWDQAILQVGAHAASGVMQEESATSHIKLGGEKGGVPSAQSGGEGEGGGGARIDPTLIYDNVESDTRLVADVDEFVDGLIGESTDKTWEQVCV